METRVPCGAVHIDIDGCRFTLELRSREAASISLINIEALLETLAAPKSHCDYVIVFKRGRHTDAKICMVFIEAGLHNEGKYLEKLRMCDYGLRGLIAGLAGVKGDELPRRYRSGYLILLRRLDGVRRHLVEKLRGHLGGRLDAAQCCSTLSLAELWRLCRAAGGEARRV